MIAVLGNNYILLCCQLRQREYFHCIKCFNGKRETFAVNHHIFKQFPGLHAQRIFNLGPYISYATYEFLVQLNLFRKLFTLRTVHKQGSVFSPTAQPPNLNFSDFRVELMWCLPSRGHALLPETKQTK